ncbi:MAG: hypothetical protein ACTHLN_01705 [Tepidisphaeraceae bacterium]
MNPSGSGYTIEDVLSPGKSWRARGGLGECVVLKQLPPDCLRGGHLHPNVKLRLTRLRELPLAAFVNIRGVERSDAGAVLVSEWVPGKCLSELPEADRQSSAREARAIVQQLHQLGYVHGNLHERNIIREPRGQVRLIDPSPLLHDDAMLDLAALDRLDPPVPGPELPSELPPDRAGRRALILAILLAIAGLSSAVVLGAHFSK